MSFRLIEVDPLTGRQLWMEYVDEATIHWQITYPVEDLLRVNASQRSETAGRPFGEWARVASIPLNFYHDSGLAQAINEGDQKFVGKVLNNSDYSAFRTKEGKV